MEIIKGYVLIGEIDDRELLFGRSVREQGASYERFTSNGLTPFERIDPNIQRELEKLLDARVRNARIYMKVATGRDEIRILKSPYILIENWLRRRPETIEDTENEVCLMGRIVGGKSKIRDGIVSIEENGFQGYQNLIEAEYYAEEDARQTGLSVAIAEFRFRRLA